MEKSPHFYGVLCLLYRDSDVPLEINCSPTGFGDVAKANDPGIGGDGVLVNVEEPTKVPVPPSEVPDDGEILEGRERPAMALRGVLGDLGRETTEK